MTSDGQVSILLLPGKCADLGGMKGLVVMADPEPSSSIQ